MIDEERGIGRSEEGSHHNIHAVHLHLVLWWRDDGRRGSGSSFPQLSKLSGRGRGGVFFNF